MYDEYRWFVVHTYSGYENKVCSNLLTVIENRGLQDMIPEVCIPTQTVVELREIKEKKPRKKKTEEDYYSFTEEEENQEPKEKKMEEVKVERKLYPGYVFVKTAVFYDDKVKETKMTDEIWYIIRNTRGVTGFVGPESKPKPLSDAEAYSLGVEKQVIEVSYKVGDLVTIIGGSFDGFSGIVDTIDLEQKTVRVIISMMGRDTPIELGLDQVESTLD